MKRYSYALAAGLPLWLMFSSCKSVHDGKFDRVSSVEDGMAVETDEDGEDVALPADLDESLSLTSNSEGFISVRLDVTAMAVKNQGKGQRYIAVMSGKDFAQRKQGYFNSSDNNGAFLDWPFLAANKNYNLYVCIDTNEDGLCKEQSFAKTIKPVPGKADQKLRIKWSDLAKSKIGNKVLDSAGAKTNKLSFRLTVSPSFNKADKKSPWSGSAGKFDVRVQEAFFKNIDTAPVVAKAQIIAGDGKTKSVVFANKAELMKSYSYQVSTCGFDRLKPCTLTEFWNPSHSDIDVAIPAVVYP